MCVAAGRQGGEGGRTGLGGADALFDLGEVAFGCFLTARTVSRGVGIGKAGPGGEFAGFDGGQPSGFDWESSGCVEIMDEGSN